MLCDFSSSALLLVTMLFDFFSLVFYSWQQCFVIFLSDLFQIALLLVTVLCDFLFRVLNSWQQCYVIFFECFILGDNVMWFFSWVLYSWQQCSVIFFLSALLFATMFRDFLLECFTLGNNVLWFPLRALLLKTILCGFLGCVNPSFHNCNNFSHAYTQALAPAWVPPTIE